MKNLFLPALLLVSLFFVSCKKDNEDSAEKKLIGKWQLKTASYYVGGQQYTDAFEPGEYLEFESGGKLTAYVDSDLTYSTWDLTNEGKTLVITDNGSLDVPEQGFEIKTLTNSSMVLYANEPNGSVEDGVTITLEK